ncbi:MAG: tetratricopeptide repeat protein [Pyrinomonadaceae bacterium]
MKNLAILLFILTLSIVSVSQERNVTISAKSTDKPSPVSKKLDEKEEFENAINQSLAGERISLLKKFLEDFPKSERRIRALEIIVGSRAELADEKLRFSDTEEGLRLFRLAVEEAPVPVSDKLFSGLLVKFPSNLFFRGQREGGIEIARMIEEKVGDNPAQLLGLATFYLSVEDAYDAKRLADKVIELKPESAAAYHTIGFANRLDFNPEAAAEAFSKALEIEPESVQTKINLAEMLRALGKPYEANSIYRGILEADPANANAQTGLILTLFDAERIDEAEAEMAKALEQNPNNLLLLTGAAYWYAAHNDGEKAVENARKVLAFEPRYTWTYIALARGLVLTGDPLSAEVMLLTARQYGNFPTLEYELAATRMAAGFYKEAAEGLRKSFTVENGVLKTKLGGRVEVESEDFIDLLARERRAGIFQYTSADNARDSLKLKELLKLSQEIDSDSTDSQIETAADEFISGDDKMKMHRQLFVANALLEKRKALPKVLEITQNAVFGVENALDVTTASAAILADELYESRKLAAARGQTIVVPEIPRQTLSKIVRGKIEEIAGWTLYQQEKTDEAILKLKLANTVLPKDSTWSRSTQWKLGTILEAQGKEQEALEAYLKGYSPEHDGSVRKIVVENLYMKLNGSLDGLEERLNKKTAEGPRTSIFTNKPIAETTEKPAESAPEQDRESVETNEKSAPASLDSSNVPRRVPIVRSVPVRTIPLDTSANEVKTDTDSNAKRPEEIPVNDPDTADPASGTKTTEADKILNPETNIAVLPPVPEKTTNEVTDSEEKAAVTETKKPAETRSLVDKILDPNTNITKLPPVSVETNSQGQPRKKPETANRPDGSLFDPVIIQVPKTAEKNTGEKPAETPADEAKETAEEILPEENAKKPDEVTIDPETKKNESDANENNPTASLERPRIVPGTEVPAAPCKIIMAQDEVSITADGGSIGLLIGLDDRNADLKKIKAVSGSPENIEILFEPEIGVSSERAFFIIRSVSQNVGIFDVTFESPCGKKKLLVTVR